MLECPRFNAIRAQLALLLQDANDSMRCLMCHRDQKVLADYIIAVLDEAQIWTWI